MAKKKRSAARQAAVDSDEASKKRKPEVHEGSVKVIWPRDTSPQIAKLCTSAESKRAMRTAEAAATKETRYQQGDFKLFAPPFKAAIASAFAETGGPVSLSRVITAMTKATGKVKIGKDLKSRFAWDGFGQGQWQISRRVPGQGLVAFPKGSSLPKKFADHAKFSPWPAARRPLAVLSK